MYRMSDLAALAFDMGHGNHPPFLLPLNIVQSYRFKVFRKVCDSGLYYLNNFIPNIYL